MLVLSSKPLKITNHGTYVVVFFVQISHSQKQKNNYIFQIYVLFFDYYLTMTCKNKFDNETKAVSLHCACFPFNCELTFLSSLVVHCSSIVVYVYLIRHWMQRTCLLWCLIWTKIVSPFSWHLQNSSNSFTKATWKTRAPSIGRRFWYKKANN